MVKESEDEPEKKGWVMGSYSNLIVNKFFPKSNLSCL